MRSNQPNIVKTNSNYIKKFIGNCNNKKFLYVGPGDGEYVKHLNIDKNNFIGIEKDYNNYKKFKSLNPGYKIYNFDILNLEKKFLNCFDVIISFSLVQYFKSSEILEYNKICNLYLKDKNSFCINMSIPNIKKRKSYILKRIIEKKYNLKGILFDLAEILSFQDSRFSYEPAYWHNPLKIKDCKINYNSDVFYRFDYSFKKNFKS